MHQTITLTQNSEAGRIKKAHTAMATRRNTQTFTATIDGKEYTFTCWSSSQTITHYCEDKYGRRTRKCWDNRTWESFRYAAVLGRAIDKFPKDLQPELRAQIIERTEKAEKERTDAMFNNFKKLHDGLSDENKKRLADSDIVMHDESDVHAVMGLMGLMTLMQGAK